MHTEPQYRPWGVPTAEFWQTATAIEAGGSSQPRDGARNAMHSVRVTVR